MVPSLSIGIRPARYNALLAPTTARPPPRHDGCRLLVADRLTQGGHDMTAPNDFAAQERDANDSYVSPEGRILEMEWRAVFENNPIMCFVVDAAGTVVSVNRSGAEQLGYA